MIDCLNVMLDSRAIMPQRAHDSDAGLDLFSREATTIPPHESAVFDTGVHVQIPQGYVGLLTSKSGLMRDQEITSAGTIDAGYTGSINAVLFNHGDTPVYVFEGQKITQLVILPIETPALRRVDSFPETERGDEGFGSTGYFSQPKKTYFALCCDQDGERHNDIPAEGDCSECCPIDLDSL